MLRTLSFVLVTAALAACTKPDPAPQPAPSAAVSAAVAVATVSAPPPVVSAAPVVPARDGGFSCGSKEDPCPLQAWMKENANPAMVKPDLPALATALDKTVTFVPAGGGYPNWVSISKDGAAAARAGDAQAAKASCRSCHDQYKKKYQAEMRDRKI